MLQIRRLLGSSIENVKVVIDFGKADVILVLASNVVRFSSPDGSTLEEWN